MDQLTLKDIPPLLQRGGAYPHYNRDVIERLLQLAAEWAPEFTPNIGRHLRALPETGVLVSEGRPIVSSSGVVGQVSWMEDFTMFAIHPDLDWDVTMPQAVAGSEYDLSVNNALSYKGGNGVAGEALVYDPAQPVASKQRADIARARKSVGDVQVHFGLPDFDALRAGVQRWDRHAMSGDYFIWQWLWVAAAGQSFRIEGEGFTCWIGFVDYADTRIFTAYQAVGDKNGMGTACLSHAMDNMVPKRTILTVPLLPDQAKRHNVERYETYKRRFANDVIPVHYLAGRWRKQGLPYPPYFNAETMEMIHAH